MSTNIDERVVKMSFDDTGFEAGANKAIGILENLKKALNLESASSGIASAQRSIDSLNLNSVSESVEECSRHFSSFEAFVFGVFSRLGQKAADLGETIVKRLTVQGAIDGFKEYELQMGSIQTILSNTGDKLKAAGLETQEEQIGYINERLDELNEYADKTIYNFSQMTRNIGLFTAAGVDLDTATSAIQGISNLAAASGSDNAAAGRAMYNLSQAISTGTVRLMDWNSVVNAGMGGELFQEALKRTARVHGIAVDEIIAKQGSFRESLSEGWLTADVLTETLEQMTIEYDEVGDAAYKAAYEQLRASGYSEDAAVAILDLAKNASEAATKVRTWTQLWDTIGESIGSGWAQTWRTIVGDFLEATDLFTWFSDRITGVVNASSDARNAILKQWADAGGRVALIDTFKNIYEIIEKPLSAIARAFSSVFGISAEQLYNITTWLALFTKRLILSDYAVEMLEFVLTDVFTIIHSVIGVFGNFVRILVSLGKIVWTVFKPFGEIAFILFGNLVDVVARASEKIHEFSDALEIQFFRIGHGFSKAIEEFVNGDITFDQMLDRMRTILNSVGNWATRYFDSVKESVKKKVSEILSLISSAVYNFLSTKVFKNLDLLSPFIKSFDDLKNALIDRIRSFTSIISGKVKAAIKLIFQAIQGKISGDVLKDRLSSIFSFFTDEMGELFSSKSLSEILTYASRFFDAAKNIAYYIYYGLRAGILDKINDLKELAKSIGEAVLNAVKNFLGIESPSKAFVEVGKNVILGLVDGIKEFLGRVSEVANDISSTLLELVSNAVSGIKNSIGNIGAKIFAKLPAPIQKALKAIKNFATTFVKQAKEIVTGSKLFQTLRLELSRIQRGELPNVLNILKSFGLTVLDVFGSIKSFASRTPIGSIFDAVTSSVTAMAEALGITLPGLDDVTSTFDSLSDSIMSSKAVTSISDFLRDFLQSIPSTFESLFEQLKTIFATGSEWVSNESGQLSLVNAATNAGLIAEEFVRIPETIEGAVDALKTAVSDFLKSFSLEKLEEYNESIHNALDLGVAVTLINFVRSLTGLNKKLSGVGQAIIGWPKELGGALARFGEGFNAWKKETKAEAVMKIAVAIAILAGALFLIASIPSDDLARAGKAMAIMSGAILGVLAALALMDSKLTLFSTASMQNAGEAIKGLGIGVLAFAAALYVLSKIPSDTMGENILTLVEIAGVLALLAKVISSDGKSIKSGAIGMILMAGAVFAMAKAVEALGNLDAEAVDKGMAPFVAIMIMLTLFGKFGGEGIGKLLASFLQFGAGLLLISISFVVFASALELISSSLKTIDNLPIVLGVLGGALVAFTALCVILKDVDVMSIATSLVIFSSALLVMTVALAALSYIVDTFGQSFGIAVGSLVALVATFMVFSYMLPPDQIKKAAVSLVLFGAALAIMAAALGAMTYVVSQGGDNFGTAVVTVSLLIAVFGILIAAIGKNSKSVKSTALSLVIFAAAIAVMAGAFLLLSKVNMKDIAPQLIAIVAAFAVFAIGASLLSGSAIAMVYVGAAMFVFSAAVMVLAGAFWVLVQALTDLSEINPMTIITRLSAMGIGLGAMVVNFVTVIFNAISTAITEHIPEIIEWAKNVINSFIEGIQSLWGWIVENGGVIVDKIGEGIGVALTYIREHGGEIVSMVIEGISGAWDWLKENGGTIVDKVGEGIIAAKDTILPKVTEFINGIKEKLGSEEFRNQVLEKGKAVGQAILDGIGLIFDGIGDVVSKLFDGLKAGITEKLNQVKEWGIGIGEALFGGAQESLEVQSPSKVFERIGGFVLEGLAKGVSDLSTITASGVDIGNALIDAMNGLPDMLFTVGQSALSMFGIGISKDNGKVGGYAKSTSTNVTNGFNGLGSSLKLKASTAMTQFGNAISSASGSLISKAGDVIRSVANTFDSLKSTLKTKASNAMAGFASGFSSGGASSAAQGVVNAVGNSISTKSLYNTFVGIGKNAVQGLIDGINAKKREAEQAAKAIATIVSNATKKGFDSHSPSKVFKQIGEYVVEGLVIGINGMRGDAADSAEALAEAVPLGFADGLSSMSIDIDDLLDADYNPVITPVINSTEFDSNLQQLSNLMNSRLTDSLSVGNLNYNETFAGKLDALADTNRYAMEQMVRNSIDYDRLGISVANALISSGVHVEMDGGQLMGYIAGEIRDTRRMFGQR